MGSPPILMVGDAKLQNVKVHARLVCLLPLKYSQHRPHLTENQVGCLKTFYSLFPQTQSPSLYPSTTTEHQLCLPSLLPMSPVDPTNHLLPGIFHIPENGIEAIKETTETIVEMKNVGVHTGTARQASPTEYQRWERESQALKIMISKNGWIHESKKMLNLKTPDTNISPTCYFVPEPNTNRHPC